MTANSISTFFQLRERQSSVYREFRGAVATFLTMAYILAVNPDILSHAGLNKASTVACTAAAAGICCILMGVIANFPLATAPGMGLNALVAYTLASQAGSWQAAMGIIFLDGIIMLLLVVAGLREAVMDAIPRDLRLATGAGIGLFIALIGLMNGKIVEIDIHALILKPGILMSPDARVALFGLVVTAVLMVWRIPGAILLGIIAATAAALGLGITHWEPRWDRPNFANAFHVDLRGALQWKLVPALFAVLMVDFFDTLGTATAIGEQAGLVDSAGRVARIRQILIVDSISASIGGLFGREQCHCIHRVGIGGSRGRAHRVAFGIRRTAVFARDLCRTDCGGHPTISYRSSAHTGWVFNDCTTNSN